MKKFGFVASGGGYRSFYTEGVLVWLQRNNVPLTHITSTSSGNNIVLDYMMWDWEKEELPPILAKTLRLNLKDIFSVFSNFLGLKPSLIPNGTHLFTVDKKACRKSLLLDNPRRRRTLSGHLQVLRWDISTTSLTQRRTRNFSVEEILAEINDRSLERFMDVFLAGITTIPYFKAITMDGEYYLEGGYLDNTPLRSLFEDPEVEEIIAVDFTDYDYHGELEKVYASHAFMLPLNSIEMNLLVSDIQLVLPNAKVFSDAALINRLLELMGKDAVEVDGKTLYRKPLRILRPKNLESMTVSLQHSRIQKEYYQRGLEDAEGLFA